MNFFHSGWHGGWTSVISKVVQSKSSFKDSIFKFFSCKGSWARNALTSCRTVPRRKMSHCYHCVIVELLQISILYPSGKTGWTQIHFLGSWGVLSAAVCFSERKLQVASAPSLTARLLQFGLWGEGFANIYLPYGSSQDTPVHTGRRLSFPPLVKQQIWNKLVELQVAQMQCYLSTRRQW